MFCAALAALAAAALSSDPSPAQYRRGADYFSNLPVVTHEGKTVRFYDDLIKDKIVIVSFIYTSCTDICPLTTARMAQVEDRLGAAVGRDLFMLSITVDPENDTPEKLKAYAQAFGTGPGWQFVTGTPEDIRAINYKLGERSRNLSEHRNEIVLGNDATGEWTRDNVLGDLERVVMTIRAMDPKWRDEVRVAPRSAASDTGLAFAGQPGQAMFKKICAPCHTIGVGDRVGPDLRGVAVRRERGWLTRYIRNPVRMLAQNDPTALALAANYPGVRMPALGIAEADAADLIAYLEAETSRLADAAAPVPSAARPERHQHHHH
jgi:cytochrome oxidase Cu insertion factor (SCO1/SenC/PrrC family)/cytochrome c2